MVFVINGNTLTEVSDTSNYTDAEIFQTMPNIDLDNNYWTTLDLIKDTDENENTVFYIHPKMENEKDCYLIHAFIKFIDIDIPYISISESFISSTKHASTSITFDKSLQEINNLEFNIWCYNKFTNSAKVFKAKYPVITQKIEPVILLGTESLVDPQKLRYEWGTTPFSFAKSSFNIAIFGIKYEDIQQGKLVEKINQHATSYSNQYGRLPIFRLDMKKFTLNLPRIGQSTADLPDLHRYAISACFYYWLDPFY